MNRNLFYILAVGFLLILVCIGLMCEPVDAYDRVPQGGILYLDDHVDISGVAAGYKELVYINEWSDGFSADNESITFHLALPDYKEQFYNFSIDRDIFSNRLGLWYRWNGFYESNSNNRAFRVVAVRPPENETIFNTTFLNLTRVPEYKPPVSERHISDYLIARGDPLNLRFSVNKSTCWIFGRLDGIYNRPVINQNISFNASEIGRFEPGSYTILFHSVGNDWNFDLRIINDKLEYFDQVDFKVHSVDLLGLTPTLVMEKILKIRGAGDDMFTLKTLEIQDPYIEITQIDSIDVNENSAVWQISGYTNLANGSELSFTLDKDRVQPLDVMGVTRAQNVWYSTVLSYTNPGSMRYFDYGIPVLYSQMAPGQHEVTVYGDHGAEMTVSKWIYVAPDEPFKPNKTTKYSAGYEFVPTPTPEIIIQKEVVKEIVTQIVRVPVTPSDAQVKSQSFNASVEFWSMVVSWLFIVLIVGGILGYIGYSLWRAKKI